MTTKSRMWLTLDAVTVMVAVAGLTMLVASPAAADHVKLTGCLVKGQGSGGYMLINPPVEPTRTSDARASMPSTIGTTGAFANIFYWIEKDGDLQPHVGHLVELEGEVKGDLNDGEIKIDHRSADGDGREIRRARDESAGAECVGRRRPARPSWQSREGLVRVRSTGGAAASATRR